MTRYFDRLGARVSAKGVAGPIYITTNNGGTLSLASHLLIGWGRAGLT